MYIRILVISMSVTPRRVPSTGIYKMKGWVSKWMNLYSLLAYEYLEFFVKFEGNIWLYMKFLYMYFFLKSIECIKHLRVRNSKVPLQLAMSQMTRV